MKMKMFLFALPCSILLIVGPSSLIAFADELSRGQTIFIGGVNSVTSSGSETLNVAYTLFNPNEDADVLITNIRVINPNGGDAPLVTPSPLPSTLPARNSTRVFFNQLVVGGPTLSGTRSQVLFTWVSASGNRVLPLKIVGVEFRLRLSPILQQVARNTVQPYLILNEDDNDDDDDD